ncbi:protein chibby homolog 1 [Chelonus insularis]|uniref:protein chibby homolog 1 n=1 Tax=Chelonus insularis TaxID=460826 RepID=UPI0015894F03|nr:protein chibby homolog 1 [Chelonus insularis]
MSILTNILKHKFSPKKTPSRKALLATKDLSPIHIEREFGPDVGPIRLKLSDHDLIFDGGIWVSGSEKAGGTHKEKELLKKEIYRLEEENNLLKLKLELVIDMLTEATAELQLHKGELENLKNKIMCKKRSAT